MIWARDIGRALVVIGVLLSTLDRHAHAQDGKHGTLGEMGLGPCSADFSCDASPLAHHYRTVSALHSPDVAPGVTGKQNMTSLQVRLLAHLPWCE